jgi:hypothetical protein
MGLGAAWARRAPVVEEHLVVRKEDEQGIQREVKD